MATDPRRIKKYSKMKVIRKLVYQRGATEAARLLGVTMGEVKLWHDRGYPPEEYLDAVWEALGDPKNPNRPAWPDPPKVDELPNNDDYTYPPGFSWT